MLRSAASNRRFGEKVITMSIIILARCEECKHHTEIFHLDWYQLICPNCNAEIENNYVEEEDIIND